MSDTEKPDMDDEAGKAVETPDHAPQTTPSATEAPVEEIEAERTDASDAEVSDAHASDDETTAAAPEDEAESVEDPQDSPAVDTAEAPPPAEPEAPDPAAPVAAAAAVSAAAETSQAEPRPIWSDNGDAPFEDEPVVRPARSQGKAKKAKKPQNETVEIIKTIVYALAIALVLRVLFFQPFTIPSASMEPNLYEGDYIVVSKWNYGYSRHAMPFSPPLFEGRIFGSQPQRGDIVVFKLPRDNSTDYIKRVIGLPGDRVQMVGGRLHINGQPVQNEQVGSARINGPFGPIDAHQIDETLPDGRTFRIQDFGTGFELDDTQVFEVPEGYYFMMGDNRDNSIDSRADVGLVPAENLVGKAQIVLFSWTPGASLWNPVSWFANLRPSRFFNGLH